MAPRRSRRRGIVAGPLVLSGLGLLALVVAAALLWPDARAVSWAALAVAALIVARTGREVAANDRRQLERIAGPLGTGAR